VNLLNRLQRLRAYAASSLTRLRRAWYVRRGRLAWLLVDDVHITEGPYWTDVCLNGQSSLKSTTRHSSL
jgi:hypothetical protein